MFLSLLVLIVYYKLQKKGLNRIIAIGRLKVTEKRQQFDSENMFRYLFSFKLYSTKLNL